MKSRRPVNSDVGRHLFQMEIRDSNQNRSVSTLSLIGSFLCLMVLFGGLTLTAIGVHNASGALSGVAIVIAGPTLTFAIVFLIGQLDHFVRARFRGASTDLQGTITRKESLQDAFRFFKMLVLGLSTVVALGLLAALLYAFIGVRNGGILIGAAVLLLAIIASIFRR